MEVFTNNRNSRKYQIGYALSGGFIKGFAHLGVMQALLEHDIKPEIISGVSAGALAGVFYADGNEPHKVLDYFSGHKFQDLTKLVIPKKGLFDLCEFIDFLRTNVKAKNLEDLQLPLIITATDLLPVFRSMHPSDSAPDDTALLRKSDINLLLSAVVWFPGATEA